MIRSYTRRPTNNCTQRTCICGRNDRGRGQLCSRYKVPNRGYWACWRGCTAATATENAAVRIAGCTLLGDRNTKRHAHVDARQELQSSLGNVSPAWRTLREYQRLLVHARKRNELLVVAANVRASGQRFQGTAWGEYWSASSGRLPLFLRWITINVSNYFSSVAASAMTKSARAREWQSCTANTHTIAVVSRTGYLNKRYARSANKKYCWGLISYQHHNDFEQCVTY